MYFEDYLVEKQDKDVVNRSKFSKQLVKALVKVKVDNRRIYK